MAQRLTKRFIYLMSSSLYAMVRPKDGVLTGIPRSGTSLLSSLLWELEDWVCFNEWCFSVSIHMENDVLEELLDMVSRYLRPDGALYGNVNLGSKDEGSWQGFPVMWRSPLFYQGVASRFNLLATDLGSLRSLGHVSGVAEQNEQRMLKFASS